MTNTVKGKKIRAIYGVTRIPDGNLRVLFEASLKGLAEHAAIYMAPPVELPIYKATIEAYEATFPGVLDGSRNAVALKNKLRQAATRMYVELAHYAEAHCNEDMQTFLLAGFLAAPNTKTTAAPLAQPTIGYVVHGPVSGQMKVKINSVPKALSYELQHAPAASDGGAPASWTQEPIGSTKPFIIGNLTPGTVYTFQVRACGRLGLTGWSDPVSRMAI